MCGLPGAGKTTRARELEREHHALRLSPDEWIAGFLGPDPSPEALDAARDPTESLQWEVAARILTLGIDVILDFGFWSREERERYRDRAAAVGSGSVVHFMDAPLELLQQRLAARHLGSVVLAALVFAAAHLSDQAAITGTVFGGLFVWRRELAFVMVMHAAFDLTAVVLIYRGWEEPVTEFFFR